ncbi:CLUMA_CG003776, isoform A [Clunio marinus]|uniref:CLUMA_CG003776, isoform A n=1 Tax=Clunio marinus TaxID=568069 RepID=A0A1J1HPS5_9DIPT|nr:CLUMA_CG003776, isoform A [Clunio marinus]
MSFRKQKNLRQNNRDRDSNKQNQKGEELDTNNPIIKQFQIYSVELDDKHDRHERLVKASRDVTIESKRIIFLLHNIDARKNNKTAVLEEAKQRIEKLCTQNFLVIARELQGYDIYQYIRAISAGIQEFIEAFTFCEYLQDKELSDWNQIEKRFKYKTEDNNEYKFDLIPCEFMLGLADLTGEIMRHCINSLGSGDTDNCFKTCKFLQNIYSKYLTLDSVPNRGRDFSQKMSTMRASTLKCEHVCYNLMVRGTEGSKLVSFDGATGVDADNDEGFF